MKISDLSKINLQDLQKISVNDVQHFLLQRRDIAICLGLVIVSIIGAITLYNSSTAQVKKNKVQIINKEGLLIAMNEQKEISGKMDEFKNTFPKPLNTDQLIDQISTLAVDNGIQIETFSPAQEQSDTYKKVVSLDITVSSPNYESLIIFAKGIESLPYSIRIDEWSGRMAAPIRQSSRSSFQDKNIQDDEISAKIKISSVELVQ